MKKDTLFYYDRIGILKPEIIEENGYRYYSLDQYMLYDIISTLRTIGVPLKDIKEYLQNRNPDSFLDMLRAEHARLEKAALKLEFFKSLLKNTIELTTQALTVKGGEPSITECEEEYLVVTRSSDTNEENLWESISKLKEHVLCRQKYNQGNALPFGSIISWEHLMQGNYDAFDYLCSKVSPETGVNLDPDDSEIPLFVKPKGTYAVIYYNGMDNSRGESFVLLKNYLRARDMKIIGPAYVFELINHLSAEEPDKHLCQIMIQVEPDANASGRVELIS